MGAIIELMRRIPLLFFTLINICGCISKGINTDDPIKSYTYWAGHPPTTSIKVLEGKYWKSGHWSSEFEVFLHLSATEEWKSMLKKQHNLQPLSQKFELPHKNPEWFRPNSTALIFTPNGSYTGPFYFEDSVSNDIYIYQLQY